MILPFSNFIVTGIDGKVSFRLRQGFYRIPVHNDVLGDRHQTADITTQDLDMIIEYTDVDQPWEKATYSILLSWNIESGEGLVFILVPIEALVLYLWSVSFRSAKRRWKYSYLT